MTHLVMRLDRFKSAKTENKYNQGSQERIGIDEANFMVREFGNIYLQKRWSLSTGHMAGRLANVYRSASDSLGNETR